jgi:hypothetical protein
MGFVLAVQGFLRSVESSIGRREQERTIFLGVTRDDMLAEGVLLSVVVTNEPGWRKRHSSSLGLRECGRVARDSAGGAAMVLSKQVGTVKERCSQSGGV